MAENYGIETTKLRLVKIARIGAENGSKSEAKIWNMAKNVVPLQCQS